VGNDMAIIDAVRQNAGTARVFSFGIGKSVNRFLLDGIARAGRGEVHYILNQQQTAGAGERFYERVRTPVLTDVALDFGDLPVEVDEVYPSGIPDLFSSKPVVVKGRYKQGAKGKITLRGTTGEGPFEREIAVDLPGEKPKDDALASLWARAKVEDLMDRDLAGMQRGKPDPAIKEEILGLGLRYQLLTQYTSFVAVEHVRITEGGQARTVAVPVEMPEGVSYEGVFGTGMGGARMSLMRARRSAGVRFAPGRGAPRSAAPALRLPPAPMEAAAESEADGRRADREPSPEDKLAPELRGLAEKLANEGTDGNLTVGKIQIRDGQIEVRVRLTDLSDEVLSKLTELGFKELAQAKSVNLVIGTIDVEKLEALAKLDAVRRVDPSL
jgi:Ca-activated chloride channel family protein